MELVYRELHSMAARQMRREHGGHTLQTTALVHKVYLRLCGSELIDWRDSSHFFAVAAQQLRRVLVDHARRGQSEKSGGGQIKFSLSDFDGAAFSLDERLLALDEALARLEALDERAAKVVELRFFGGLNEYEAAEALKIPLATLKRLGFRPNLARQPAHVRNALARPPPFRIPASGERYGGTSFSRGLPSSS